MSLPPVVAPAVRRLRVRRFQRITTDAAELTLDLEGVPFAFVAGQAAWLGRTGQDLRKPYSIANGPADAARHDRLLFLVGLEVSGAPDRHLEGLAPGTRVDVDGPVGAFRLPPLDERPSLLFLAGGTGIAPLRAMVTDVLETRPEAKVHLVYSARSIAHVAWLDDWHALEADGRLTLDVTLSREAPAGWRGPLGRIAPATLVPRVGPGTIALLCGPDAFVRDVSAFLRQLGISPDRIRREEW